tara:strand:- start:215 stop:367 length:153 start_codon:yes stop_codon:yes gene_type:complete
VAREDYASMSLAPKDSADGAKLGCFPKLYKAEFAAEFNKVIPRYRIGKSK